MTTRTAYADVQTSFHVESENTIERLERVKLMASILEAQLIEKEPSLGDLASNMSDEIDAIVERFNR